MNACEQSSLNSIVASLNWKSRRKTKIVACKGKGCSNNSSTNQPDNRRVTRLYEQASWHLWIYRLIVSEVTIAQGRGKEIFVFRWSKNIKIGTRSSHGYGHGHVRCDFEFCSGARDAIIDGWMDECNSWQTKRF